ncbi:hypothetical protein E4412_18630 [Leptospira interrogans]|nr:hypothetical protein E4412_18630 [Leptospira interrogans]
MVQYWIWRFSVQDLSLFLLPYVELTLFSRMNPYLSSKAESCAPPYFRCNAKGIRCEVKLLVFYKNLIYFWNFTIT